jgi:hypothetical protein
MYNWFPSLRPSNFLFDEINSLKDMMENKTLYKQNDKDCFISSSTDQEGSSSSLERSTYIKFQLQKTYNGLIWGAEY